MKSRTASSSTVPLADVMAEFSEEDRAAIETQADRLVQESRTIAQLRREIGMTQAELAAALEASQAYVAKVERNPSADMQISTIARIASAFGGTIKVVVSLPGRPDATLAIPTVSKRRRSPSAPSKAKRATRSARASA